MDKFDENGKFYLVVVMGWMMFWEWDFVFCFYCLGEKRFFGVDLCLGEFEMVLDGELCEIVLGFFGWLLDGNGCLLNLIVLIFFGTIKDNISVWEFITLMGCSLIYFNDGRVNNLC